MTAAVHQILGAFSGVRLDPLAERMLANGMPGVTLFRNNNIDTADQVLELNRSIHQAAGDLPALICTDQEGGQLQALAGIVTDAPGALAMAAAGDPALTGRLCHAIGLEMRALGFTVNYAPVCDLLTNARNHSLSIRSYGTEAPAVREHTSAAVAGFQRAGIAATGKHFPGKGGATVDSHYHRVVIERTKAQLAGAELVPFEAAVAADVRLMMTSHASYPALSLVDTPASLNREILTDLLRGDMGFEGVTVTDALDMAAVGEGDVASADESADALRAGADLLLTTPSMDVRELAEGLAASFDVDPMPDSEIAASTQRIRELRQYLAGFAVPDTDLVGCSDHAALADEVALRAITEVSPGTKRTIAPDALVVQPAGDDLTKADTTTANSIPLGEPLGVRHHWVHHGPTDSEIAGLRAEAKDRDVVVVVTAAATEAGQRELVRELEVVAANTTVVLGRNPMDLGHIEPGAARVLCSYGLSPSSSRAVARTISEGLEPTGTLPVVMKQ